MSWADVKPTMKERHQAEPKEPKEPKRPRKPTAEAGSSDPEAIRTLVLTGLPSELTKAVLWKKVRKVNENLELRYPVEEDATGELNISRANPSLPRVPLPRGSVQSPAKASRTHLQGSIAVLRPEEAAGEAHHCYGGWQSAQSCRPTHCAKFVLGRKCASPALLNPDHRARPSRKLPQVWPDPLHQRAHRAVEIHLVGSQQACRTACPRFRLCLVPDQEGRRNRHGGGQREDHP